MPQQLKFWLTTTVCRIPAWNAQASQPWHSPAQKKRLSPNCRLNLPEPAHGGEEKATWLLLVLEQGVPTQAERRLAEGQLLAAPLTGVPSAEVPALHLIVPAITLWSIAEEVAHGVGGVVCVLNEAHGIQPGDKNGDALAELNLQARRREAKGCALHDAALAAGSQGISAV